MSAIPRSKIALARSAHRCKAFLAEQICARKRQSTQAIYNIAKDFNALRVQICLREPPEFDSRQLKQRNGVKITDGPAAVKNMRTHRSMP